MRTASAADPRTRTPPGGSSSSPWAHEGQEIIATTGRTVPSNIAVSRSASFLDPTKAPSHASVFLDAVAVMQRVPTVSTWPEIEDVTNGILENALYRGDRLDDVIRELDEKTRPLFARAAAP